MSQRLDFHQIRFFRLIFLAALLTCLAQAVHELGHWSVYQANGRGPVWGFTSLVQVWDEPPLRPTEWAETTSQSGARGWLRLRSLPQSPTEEFFAAAAGPFASLIGIWIGLGFFSRSRQSVSKQISLMFALTGSFAMSMYYLRSGFRTGGDEAQMADLLHISKAAIEILFALGFIVCLMIAVRALGGWQTILKWMAALLLGSISTGLLLMKADAIVRAQVNLENPFFRPLFGISLPVLLVYIVVLAGVLALWRSAKPMTFDR